MSVDSWRGGAFEEDVSARCSGISGNLLNSNRAFFSGSGTLPQNTKHFQLTDATLLAFALNIPLAQVPRLRTIARGIGPLGAAPTCVVWLRATENVVIDPRRSAMYRMGLLNIRILTRRLPVTTADLKTC